MPFGDYKDFADCVSKNADKEDPKGYCASIQKKIEGEIIKRDVFGRQIIAENVPIIFHANIDFKND